MPALSVMTWNLENLYRPGTAYGPKTEADYQQKLHSLARTILALNPDILALQEIGDRDALTDLQGQLDNRYPHHAISNAPDPRGIRVAFLSKLAIAETEDISTLPDGGLIAVVGRDSSDGRRQVPIQVPTEPIPEITRMGRGILRILVRPKPGFDLHLLNAHLKSKLLTFTDAQGKPRFSPRDENERARVAGMALLKRTAEAVALRVKANQLLEDNANQGLILLGDLNDVPDAATTQILLGPGGSQITDTTPGPNGLSQTASPFNRRDQGDDTRLFNLAALIPRERRYSRIYNSNPELIDHILASQELFPGSPRRLPTVDSHADSVVTLPSIGDNPSDRRGKPGSDHAPITAHFDL